MLKKLKERIVIRVPATTANLGPGFDTFGGALNIYNEFFFYSSNKFEFIFDGIDCELLKEKKENLFFKTLEIVSNKIEKEIPKGMYHFKNNIPIGKGLGSSATAILMAIMFINLFYFKKFDEEEVINQAIEIEGHPDNVIPAFYGGIRVIYKNGTFFKSVKLKIPVNLDLTLIIPEKRVSTELARRILPKDINLNEAIFNLSRASLLVYALENRRYELLKEAFQDRIHQEKRMSLVKGLKELFDRIVSNKFCLGGWLSGSGSSMAFLSEKDETEAFHKFINSELEGKNFSIIKTKFSKNGLKYYTYS